MYFSQEINFLLTSTPLLNSVISDAAAGAKFASFDIKDFFLATPMKEPEYMRLLWKHIPEDIKKKYNLYDKQAQDGYVYIKIKKGMYGLKQAAILAFNNLVTNLSKAGYRPIMHTLGMWEHKTRRTKFCLCVDDFGVKYFSREDGEHLLHALQDDYTVTTDWGGHTLLRFNH